MPAVARRKRIKRISDPFKFDRELLAELDSDEGDLGLAGTDEAGRGCLAGPLVAAAVVLDYSQAGFPSLRGLTDSKMLSLPAREAMYGQILRTARRVAWTACSPGTIDSVGLHKCNLAILRRALELLEGEYRMAVVDAFELRRPDLAAKAIIGADYKSAAVAAASVVAKVVRDRVMRSLHPLHPEYGFAEHVGYATEQHREALRVNGPCRLHRMSFQGVGATQLELWKEGILVGVTPESEELQNAGESLPE
jgi:ribonuclease HII